MSRPISGFREVSDEDRERFLDLFERFGNQANCCKIMSVRYKDITHLKEVDPEFSEAYKEAQEKYIDRFEGLAFQRAEGIPVPAVDKDGKPILHPVTGEQIVQWQGSNNMLQFVLKGNRKKYAIERREISGPDGTPLARGLDLSALSPDEIRQLLELSKKVTTDADV